MKAITFKARITVVFFAAYLLLSFCLIFFFYQRAFSFQKEELRNRLIQAASLTAANLKAENIDNIRLNAFSVEIPDYQIVVKELRKAKAAALDISDFYVLVSSNHPDLMQFVANASLKDPVEPGDYFNIAGYPQLKEAFLIPSADKEITQDKWGRWLSGYAPIKRADGSLAAILGVDIPAVSVALIRNEARQAAAYVFFAGLLAAILIANLVSRWLSKPMDSLIKGMDQISTGNIECQIPSQRKDEFGLVSRNFNKMAKELKKYIENLTKVLKEKERINKELEIATKLQKAMLPNHEINIKGLDVYGVSLPAKVVGGDYFDYVSNKSGKLGIVIGDASGKGLPSSIFIANSKNIFKVVTDIEEMPAKVMRTTNIQIMNNVSESAAMFTTMFYGIYDIERNIFTYSNAGHNPPIFAKNSIETSLLKAHGCPLGVLKKENYGQNKIKISAGDAFLFYTDGVTEAINKEGEMFGLELLEKKFLNSIHLSAKEIVNRIKDEVFNFICGNNQFDDMTLVVFKKN